MPAFSNLETIASAADDDRLLIRDVSAGVGRAITRANFLADYPKSSTSQDADFRDVTVNDLSAASVDTSALTIAGGAAEFDGLIRADGTAEPSDILTLEQELVTASVTGITTAHIPIVNFLDALPAGLIVQPSIRAAGTLTLAFFNATGSTISGASYAWTAAFLRVSAA